MEKWFCILFSEGTNYYVDPMLLDTYCITDAHHMNVPILLDTYYIFGFLDTCYILNISNKLSVFDTHVKGGDCWS